MPAGSPTSYAFLATDPRSGGPVGFDPCETEIHYVIRPDGSPPEGDAIVAEAFAEASRVTGFTFVLDGQDLAPELDRRGGRVQVRSVVLHEIGHLLGLDHVADPSQVMYEFSSPDVTAYQAGDLAGLEALGTGRCSTP